MSNVKLSEKGKAFLKRTKDAARVAEYLSKAGADHNPGECFVVPLEHGSVKLRIVHSSTIIEK